MASRVYRPCFSAFLFPGGAPDPSAPPCMRHLIFQPTAGDRQGWPDRVVAPQRRLDRIGPVLRGWWIVIFLTAPGAELFESAPLEPLPVRAHRQLALEVRSNE